MGEELKPAVLTAAAPFSIPRKQVEKFLRKGIGQGLCLREHPGIARECLAEVPSWLWGWGWLVCVVLGVSGQPGLPSCLSLPRGTRPITRALQGPRHGDEQGPRPRRCCLPPGQKQTSKTNSIFLGMGVDSPPLPSVYVDPAIKKHVLIS